MPKYVLCFPNSSAPTELSKSYEVAQRFKKISLLFFLLILTTKASCLLHLYPVVYTGQKRYKSFPYLHMAEVLQHLNMSFFMSIYPWKPCFGEIGRNASVKLICALLWIWSLRFLLVIFLSEGIGLKKCFAGNFRVRLVRIGPSFFCLVLTVPLYVNMF